MPSLRFPVFQLRCGLVTRVCVVVIRQVDKGHFARIVAAEECGTLVHVLGDESGDWWDDGHAC
jgi:hypothetical protein